MSPAPAVECEGSPAEQEPGGNDDVDQPFEADPACGNGNQGATTTGNNSFGTEQSVNQAASEDGPAFSPRAVPAVWR